MSYNPTGQGVIESFNHTLKYMLNKQKCVINIPKDRLHSAMLTLKLFKC